MNSHREKVGIFFRQHGKICIVAFSFFVALWSLNIIFNVSISHKLHVSFLDVGQGDSIFIQTPSGHTMIVDGGPTNAVLTQLDKHMNYFARDIDIMVATHPDSDHVTGLIPVLEKYDVRSVILSGEKSDTQVFQDIDEHIHNESAEIRIADAGDKIDFQDGVTATILHPYTGEHFKDTNSASVSMVLQYGDENFLLTGDLPSDKERLLLSSKLLPKNITVYKAGHHGSKYSSGEQLLTYIKPEYAVISAGKDNKYGHPNPEAIERLQKYAKEIVSTINQGTISFITDGRVMEMATQK